MRVSRVHGVSCGYKLGPLPLILLVGATLAYGQILVPTDLKRCPKGAHSPESVHIVQFEALAPDGRSRLSPYDSHLLEKATEYYNQIGYGSIRLQASAQSVPLVTSEHDFLTELNATLESFRKENLVGVLGVGNTPFSSAFDELMDLRDSYLYLDDQTTREQTGPLVSKISNYDYVSALVFARELRAYGVTRVGVVRDDSCRLWLKEFESHAASFGFSIEMVTIVPANDLFMGGPTIRSAVQSIKDLDLRYIVAFLSPRELIHLFGHAVDQGLDNDEKPITWIGDSTFKSFQTGDVRVRMFWEKRFTPQSPLNQFNFSKSIKASYDNITHLIDGSFRLQIEFALSEMGREFFSDLRNASGLSNTEEVRLSMDMTRHEIPTMYIADAILTVGYAVNAMANAGYGCYLNHANFTSEVAYTLFEYQKRIYAEGFTDVLQFNSAGDRMMRNLTWHGCSSRHAPKPQHEGGIQGPSLQTGASLPNAGTSTPAGTSLPAGTSSSVSSFDSAPRVELHCVAHKNYDSNTGEFLWDFNETIFWHGNASSPPDMPPSDGTVFEVPGTQIVLEEKLNDMPFTFWLAVFIPTGFAFMIMIFVIYTLWKLFKSAKSMLADDFDAKIRNLELESPMVRAVKLLQKVGNGERVRREDALKLSAELLTSKDVLQPNLKDQLSVAKSPYNQDVSRFLVQVAEQSAVWSEPPSASLRSVNSSRHAPTRTSRSSSGAESTVELQLAVREISALFNNDMFGQSLHFNILKIGEVLGRSSETDSPLVFCTMHLVRSLDLVAKLKLDEPLLKNFLSEVERGYDAQTPYHNNCHAADVMQRLVAILQVSGVYPRLISDVEMFSAILAAAIHDVGHPGRNNAFMVNTNSEVAHQYNDQQVLENHSLVTGFELMRKFEFHKNMPSSARKEMRKIIISMVLATDMSRHFAVVSQFSQKITRSDVEMEESRLRLDQKMVLLEMCIKAADIGHTTLFESEHVHWVQNLQKEFFLQGDDERERKINISPLCDRMKERNGPAVGENQIGFFDVICIPLYSALVDVFPSCISLSSQLQCNYKYWVEDMNAYEEIKEQRKNNCKLSEVVVDTSGGDIARVASA